MSALTKWLAVLALIFTHDASFAQYDGLDVSDRNTETNWEAPLTLSTFPRDELHARMAEIANQSKLTQRKFFEARDVTCTRQTWACIDALESMSAEFSKLASLIVKIDRLTDMLDNPDVVGGIDDEEKREIRRDYSVALKNTVVWVVGLDTLLNMVWRNFSMRKALERAQTRLFNSIESYVATQNVFTKHVKRTISERFPPPRPK